MLRLFQIFVFCLIVCSLTAQTTFNKRYQFGTSNNVFMGLVVTDSCYYLSGLAIIDTITNNPGALFAKIDLDGEVEFYKVYVDSTSSFEFWNMPLKQLSDGEFATGGHFYGEDNLNKALLMKFNQFGDTSLVSTYSSPYSQVEDFIVSCDLHQTQDSGFLILNSIYDPVVYFHQIGITKMDSNGMIEYQYDYGDNWRDIPGSFVLDEEENIIIGAVHDNQNFTNNNFNSKNYIFKINPEGEILWEFHSPDSLGLLYFPTKLFLTTDGGIVIVTKQGIEKPVNLTTGVIEWNGLIYKVDSSLQIEWTCPFRSSEPSIGNVFSDATISMDGGFVATGTVRDTNYVENKYRRNGWVTKVNANGDSLWYRIYHFVSSEDNIHHLYDIESTFDGGYVIAGQAINSDTEVEPISQRSWLLKLDEHGCLVPGCHLVATEELKETGLFLKLYPNPSSDFLNIFLQRSDFGVTQFRIISLDGKVLKEFEVEAQETTILVDLNTYANGVYLLQAIDDRKVILTEEFVIQH